MSKLLTTGIRGSEELQQLLIQLYRRLGKNVTVEASYGDYEEIEVDIREVETKDLTGLGTCLPNVDDEFVSALAENRPKLKVGDLVVVDDLRRPHSESRGVIEMSSGKSYWIKYAGRYGTCWTPSDYNITKVDKHPIGVGDTVRIRSSGLQGKFLRKSFGGVSVETIDGDVVNTGLDNLELLLV